MDADAETGVNADTDIGTDGDPVDPDREYVVAAPSFAFGVDGFEPLAPERIGATYAPQHDVLETHLRRTDGPVGL